VINWLFRLLRNKMFWYLDKKNHNLISRAYKEIKEIDELDSNSSLVNNFIDKSLVNLLKHASTTTKFYKDFSNEINTLNDFPVINKNIIRENQDDFISKQYEKSDLVTISTSGSTGTPFVCYQNIEKKRRVNAEIIYYSEKVNYSVGDNLIFLRSLNEANNKTKFKQWIQNENLIDINNLNDQNIEKLLKQLEKRTKNGSVLLSYASTLDELTRFYNKNNIMNTFNVKGMISGAEMLYDETRTAMEKLFDCQCVSRYSNQENGVLGQDELDNNIFIINQANYIVEIFKINSDELACEGEVGRIVVTDLHNYGMPMVRYDTGDVGSITFIERNGVKKKAISDFGGRKIDMIYDCDGNVVSPHKISVSFWAYPELKQFQFVQQNETEYFIKLNVDKKFVKEVELKNKMLSLLGEEAIIYIEQVEEIPALSSGKRKYIVNNWI